MHIFHIALSIAFALLIIVPIMYIQPIEGDWL